MHWRTFLILLWLVAFIVVEIITCQHADTTAGNLDFWKVLAFGGALAAIGLVGVWLVFGRGLFIGRLMLMPIVVIAGAFLLTKISSEREKQLPPWFIFFASELLLAAAPLALLRRFCLLQICQADLPSKGNANNRGSSQFTLAMLMTWVCGFALFLGMLRWLVRLDALYLLSASIGAVFGVAAFLTIFVAWIRGFVVLRVMAFLLLSTLIAFGIWLKVWKAGDINLDLRILAFVVLSEVLPMAASLLVFRVCGWRLERPAAATIAPSEETTIQT